jgi:hypothetical protein
MEGDEQARCRAITQNEERIMRRIVVSEFVSLGGSWRIRLAPKGLSSPAGDEVGRPLERRSPMKQYRQALHMPEHDPPPPVEVRTFQEELED